MTVTNPLVAGALSWCLFFLSIAIISKLNLLCASWHLMIFSCYCSITATLWRVCTSQICKTNL